MMVCVPSADIMLVASFHALRKPYCDSEPNKLRKTTLMLNL